MSVGNIPFYRTVNGLNKLDIDELEVNYDTLMKGNLTVLGTITGNFQIEATPEQTVLNVTNNYGPVIVGNDNANITVTDDKITLFDDAIEINFDPEISLEPKIDLNGDVQVNGPMVTTGPVTAAGGIIAPVFVTENNQNGETKIESRNNDSGPNATSSYRMYNDVGSAVLFLNSSTRTTDGGPNTCTIRNEIGDIRLVSPGGGITIFSDNGKINFTSNTQATNPSTAACTFIGGVGIQKKLFVGDNTEILYQHNGATDIIVRNTSNGSSARSRLCLFNDTGETQFNFNSSTRTQNGGSNMLEILNNVGEITLNSLTANFIMGAVTILDVPLNLSSTTVSTSTTTGALTIGGGLGVVGNGNFGGTLVSNSFQSTDGQISKTVDGACTLLIKNNSTDPNAISQFKMGNSGSDEFKVYMNGTGNVTEPNTVFIRNDAGDLKLQSKDSFGLTIKTSTGNTTVTSTTELSGSVASLVTEGGALIKKNFQVNGNATITGSLGFGSIQNWTPTYQSGITVTYLDQNGKYYVVGSIVHVWGVVVTSSAIDSTPSSLQINGLPFTNNGPRTVGTVLFDNFGLPVSTDTVNCFMDGGGTSIYFQVSRDDLAPPNVTSPTTSKTRTVSFYLTLIK